MKYLSRIALSGMAITAAFFAIHPELREMVRFQFSPTPYRRVLATVSGDLLNSSKDFKVIKIKSHEGLFIEIYEEFQNNTRPIFARIKLPDKRDGYFHFQGQATNLALDDLDGDQFLEVIAPSFDDNFQAHLNVFRYNQATHSYEAWKP